MKEKNSVRIALTKVPHLLQSNKHYFAVLIVQQLLKSVSKAFFNSENKRKSEKQTKKDHLPPLKGRKMEETRKKKRE